MKRGLDTTTGDPAVARMLLQLNLHKALEHNFRGHQVFVDLRRKQEGDAIFGKAYIAESVIRLHEALFGNCFHLNALTEGGRTELFSALDKLKTRINNLIDAPDDTDDTEDKVSRLLARVIEETRCSSRIELLEDSSKLPERATAGDTLCYLSSQTLEAVERQLTLLVGQEISGDSPIATVPIDYSGPGEDSARTLGKESVKLIADSVREVSGLAGLEGRMSQAVPPELRGTILYSPSALSLYVNSTLFKGVAGTAVFDDASGNYIYLLIAPEDVNKDAAVRQLLLRSLYWLDFDTSESRQVICAGIRYLTREEMRDHLSMLGKLLPYAAYTGGSLDSEESVRNSVDYFLESVV